jgi:hypothetical protein
MSEAMDADLEGFPTQADPNQQMEDMIEDLNGQHVGKVLDVKQGKAQIQTFQRYYKLHEL